MGRYPEVESVLDDYSGLDVQSIGRQIFERAAELRLNQASEGSYTCYLKRLKAEAEEVAQLLDLLLVPETWFFRDAGTFAFLTALVKSEWCARPDRGALQVLSVPCSTGEEPYSIAITLLDAGLNPSQFRIHALDISSKALSAAKEGRYTNASLRNPLTAVQARFFERGEEQSTVGEQVRSLVSFSQGNLVDPNFMGGSEKRFDFIFCKNLLIYLSQAGRARVMANLDRLLKENGFLFVGHSEVALFHKAGYAPVSSARAFGLTRPHRAEARPIQVHRRVARVRSGHDGHGDNRPPSTRPTLVSHVTDGKDAVHVKSAVSVLETAQALADRGDLQEAANLCRSLIGENSMDVGAYYLAGLIEQSLDRLAPAEEFFLKAIYLDPDHYDTLVQLCLLSEKKGDLAKAGQYRKRLRRLEAGAKEG
jgi:chemotaxis protein methyltransferase WspC